MAATTALSAVWGVTGTATLVTGIITELSVTNEAVLEPVQNEIGAVIGNVQYDTRHTMTATVLISSGATLPAAGAAITLGGVAGHVVRAEKIEGNTACQKIRVEAESHANAAGAAAVPGANGAIGS